MKTINFSNMYLKRIQQMALFLIVKFMVLAFIVALELYTMVFSFMMMIAEKNIFKKIKIRIIDFKRVYKKF